MAGKKFYTVGLRGDTRDFTRKFMTAKNTVGSFGNFITGTVVPGVMAAGAAIGAMGIKAVRTTARMDSLRKSFEIMLGSADKAKRVVEDLTQFTAETPFQLEDVATSSRQLIAAGVSIKDLTKEMKMLGDIASVTNVPLNDMAHIYTKAMNKGKLQAEELNQLSERGIPIMRELAKMYDTNKEAIFKMAEQGKIKFEDLQQAMINMTSEGGIAFNAMQKQSQELEGAFSNLQDNATRVLDKVGGYIADKLNLKRQIMQVNELVSAYLKVPTRLEKINSAMAELQIRNSEIAMEMMRIRKNGVQAWEIKPLENYKKELEAVNSLLKKMQANMPTKKFARDFDFTPKKDKTSATRSAGNFQQIDSFDDRTVEVKFMDEKLKDAKDSLRAFNEESRAMTAEERWARVAEAVKDNRPPMVQLKNDVEEVGRTMEDVAKTTITALDIMSQGVRTLANLYQAMSMNNINALNAQHEAEMTAFEEKNKGASDYDEKLRALQERQKEERDAEVRKQAQIQKTMALFEAALAIPRAYLQGLMVGGPSAPAIAAAYAALATAQMGVIAATNIPSFKVGTSDYTGLAKLHEGETLNMLPANTRVVSKGMTGTNDRMSGGSLAFHMDAYEFSVHLDKVRKKSYKSL